MDVEALKSGIASLAPTPGKQTKRQIVATMLAEIDGALARGITLEQIRSYLDGHGLELGLSTLRQYVADARKHSGKKRKARRPATPPSTPKPPAPKATPGTDTSKFVNIKDEDL
jgi:hypothetical protein